MYCVSLGPQGRQAWRQRPLLPLFGEAVISGTVELVLVTIGHLIVLVRLQSHTHDGSPRGLKPPTQIA